MAKVARNPARKTPANLAGHVGWHSEARKAELEAMSLEEVLAELGRVVTRYTVTTALAWDGRSEADREAGGPEPEPDGRLISYAVSYEMRRPGRPLFCCGGFAGPYFATLHGAAVWALLGALAWTGAFSEGVSS